MASKKVVEYTANQLKNLFKNLKSATAIDRKVDSLISKDNVKNSNSQIIAAGNAASKNLDGPKPILRAKRTIDKKVTDKLKTQEAEAKAADTAKAKGEKPKGAKPTADRKPRSPAVDKPKVAKKDTRAASAGDNLTGANIKAIKDAPTTQALTSLKSKIYKEIDALKNITDQQKKKRKIRLSKMIDDTKKKLRKVSADAAKPKKEDTRPAARKPQSSQERQQAAIGNISAKTTTQQNKKQGVGSMVSYTSLSRAKAIEKAGRDLRANRINQTKYDEIIRAIDRKDAQEASAVGRKISSSLRKKPVKPLENPFEGMNVGGLAQTKSSQTGLKKLPTAVRNKMGYMNRGGSVKSGSTDMRKGGMFYK
tara:strand:- start:442 stop:1536 length:1095 start_codon:yes stop_codon:yes gene_type:complete